MTALQLIPFPDPLTAFDDVGCWGAPVGAMWPCKHGKHRLADRQPCLIVRMPEAAAWWHTNSEATDPPHGLWNVSWPPGHPELLTVTPSINIGPEIWHGFITEGQMTP